MNSLINNIIFITLQMQKGNRNKKIKNDLVNSLNKFKCEEDTDIFNELFSRMVSKKMTIGYIDANLFPMTIDAIRRWGEIDFSNNFEVEVRWWISLFKTYEFQINEILSYRKQIDCLILQSKYEAALEVLDEVEKKYGFSYWLLENKVYLWNKLNKDVDTDIIGKSRDCITTTILRFYNLKSSEDMTSRDYDYITRKEILKYKRVSPKNKDSIEYYHYMIAPFSYEFNDDGLIYLMLYNNKMPLIDRYLCFIDVSSYLVTSNNEDLNNILRKYINSLSCINDDTLLTIRFILDTKESRKKNYELNTTLLEFQNDFIVGKIEECKNNIIQYIQNNTDDIGAINLYIESCALLKIEASSIVENSNIDIIIKNLKGIYGIEKNYNNSIDEIYNIICCCSHSSWAKIINANVLKSCQSSDKEEQKVAEKYSELQHLRASTVCYCLDKEDAIDFINSIGQLRNTYIEFRKSVLNEDYLKAESLTGIVAMKNIMKVANYSKSDELKNNGLIGISENSSIFKIRFAKVFWSRMDLDKYFEIGVDYFLDLFINNEYIALVAPVQKFINYLDENVNIDRSNIRVPILYYIYVNYFKLEKKDDLAIVCEDFLYYQNIEKPSVMKISDKVNRNLLIYFLRYVCVQQIMSTVLFNLKTSNELDQERIDTCQLLCNIDRTNEKNYEQEIKEITHKLFVNAGLQTIENSKIHVNTEGIKARLIKDTKSDFNRYMYYRNHKLDFILGTLNNIEGLENIQTVSIESSQLFREIILKIRDAFVSSDEYGLDGYLSLNIRHGTLADQLRRPLVKTNLFTTFDVEKKEYIINPMWLNKLEDSDQNNLRDAIIEFNKETEEIIEYLKKTLIQISTEEKPSKGVFNYDFDDYYIDYWQVLLMEDTEFEDFIEKIFIFLWKFTHKNLQKMKEIIKQEISRKYVDAFNKLNTVIKDINERTLISNALRKVNEASNDMQNELDKICNWFKRSTLNENVDFDLDLAFQIGLKMIQNVHPEKIFKIENLEKNFDKKIEGKFLKSYWDIFYTIFDNISKYAMVKSGKINIYGKLEYLNDQVYIYIRNDYDCSKDISNDKRKLLTARSLIDNKTYLSKAKKEGGSGIPKICKSISVDLYRKPEIEFGFIKEENKFYIEIKGGR
ncbi:hypothetical protein FC961_05590 [Clostridium botulinum]|nr:hypothetical protein [Clostridium botulinum]NFO91326.1 hypothetical protein [Clostridium botulinum]